MPEVVIIGGGVIGLASALELATSGAKVCVIDQGALQTSASWAAGGGNLLLPRRSL